MIGLNQSAGVGLCWGWTGNLNNLMSYQKCSAAVDRIISLSVA